MGIKKISTPEFLGTPKNICGFVQNPKRFFATNTSSKPFIGLLYGGQDRNFIPEGQKFRRPKKHMRYIVS